MKFFRLSLILFFFLFVLSETSCYFSKLNLSRSLKTLKTERKQKVDLVEKKVLLEPEIIYSSRQGKYLIQKGDNLYSVLGVPSTHSYLERGGQERIYSGETLYFSYSEVRGLPNNLNPLIETYDSLFGQFPETLLIVIRDKGKAFLVSFSKSKPFLVIWSSYVSVGKKHSDGRGMPTPQGFFRIVQKKRSYWSKRYQCQMPYAQRLGFLSDTLNGYIYKTWWSPWWIHQGYTTGKPCSHGCIRLPKVWAMALWDLTSFGLRVVVLDYNQFFQKKELISLWQNSNKIRQYYAQRIKI